MYWNKALEMVPQQQSLNPAHVMERSDVGEVQLPCHGAILLFKGLVFSTRM